MSTGLNGLNSLGYNMPDTVKVEAKRVIVTGKAFGKKYVKLVRQNVAAIPSDSIRRRATADSLVTTVPVTITGMDKALPAPLALRRTDKRHGKTMDALGDDAKRPLRQQNFRLPQAVQLQRLVLHQGKLVRQIESARQIGNQSRADNLSDQHAKNVEAINMIRKLCPELETVYTIAMQEADTKELKPADKVRRVPVPADMHKAIRRLPK